MNKKIVVAGAAAFLATSVALGAGVSSLKTSPEISKAAAHITLADQSCGGCGGCSGANSCGGCSGNTKSCGGAAAPSSSSTGSCGGCAGNGD